MRTPTGVTIAQYQQAISDGKPTHVRLTFPNQNIVLDDSNITMDGGLTLSTIPNPDSDLTIGYAPANVLDVEFFNTAIFTGFNWTEEFKLEAGVEINGTTNWILIGWFKGQKPEKTLRTQTIQFTAYDMMVKFDKLADDWIDSLTFPMTMQAMFRSLCTYVGLGYASSPVNQITAAMNASYSTNPFFKGVSCRAILSWIAEANGCYAIYRPESGGTGVIDLRFVNSYTSSMTIPENDCYEVDLEDYTIPAIDYIHLASSDENVPGFTYPLNKTHKYEILDNPLMLLAGTSAKQGMINGIISHFAVMGNYRPMRIVTVGNWLMEVGDMVEVELADGTTYNLIGINKTIQWNGGCVCEYECPGNIERLEMNQNKKEKYEIGGKLSDKYTIISGVDITDDGVVVSGNKYVKIYSGGKFLVDATNFKIDSDNKYMQAGDWVFDTKGAKWKDKFFLGNHASTDLPANNGCMKMSVDGGSMVSFAYYENRVNKANINLSVEKDNVTNEWESVVTATRITGSKQVGWFQRDGSNIIPIGSYNLGDGTHDFIRIYSEYLQPTIALDFKTNSRIRYVGTKATTDMIRFKDNTADAYGNGIIIGGGGLVVIGAGESAAAMESGKSAGTEDLYLGADGAVFIYSNVNNGIGSAKQFQFNASGTFSVPGRIYQNGNQAVPLQDTNTWRGYEIKQYQYTYTIPANGDVSIRASDFMINATPGYTAAAIAYFNTSDSNVECYYLNPTATGYDTVAMLHNRANAQVSHPMAIKILFLQTGQP